MYSFAVMLSIKLRLLLFDAGSAIHGLDTCRLTIRSREKANQVVSVCLSVSLSSEFPCGC